jgi:hypothetical protein
LRDLPILNSTTGWQARTGGRLFFEARGKRGNTTIDKDVILFLDETQACPSSLNALRYFWEKNQKFLL